MNKVIQDQSKKIYDLTNYKTKILEFLPNFEQYSEYFSQFWNKVIIYKQLKNTGFELWINTIKCYARQFIT